MYYLGAFLAVSLPLLVGGLVSLKWPRAALLAGSLLLLAASLLPAAPHPIFAAILDEHFRWILRVLGGVGLLVAAAALLRPPLSPEEAAEEDARAQAETRTEVELQDPAKGAGEPPPAPPAERR